jgi:colicin import membrane protein
MPSTYDRNDFVPPRDAGSVRAFTLALLAHGLLIAALTWGVNWKRSDQSVSFEAELWSNVAQEAAPALAPPPPPPPPPEPVVKAPAVQPPPAPDVDIALEQEKKRKQLAQQKQAEAVAQKQKERAQAEQAKEKIAKEQKAKEDQAKRKALEDAKKLEARKQEAREQTSAAALDKQRRENIARAMGLAGASGDDNARGSAQKSSGASAAYKARLAALFKRNINFSTADSIQGNPEAVVQVKVSSTGLIMSKSLTKSSGVPAWDEAVLRAVEKTERIPLDENGKVVPDFPIRFGPKD